jgi:arginyl-tRNA synthetase
VIEYAKKQIDKLLADACEKARASGKLPEGDPMAGTVEIPKDAMHGDYAATHAMAAAKVMKLAPRKIAEALIEYLDIEGSFFSSVSVAGAGFINFFAADVWYGGVLQTVEDMGDKYGAVDIGNGKRVMVEFVSANPTGPMTLGNARGGVLGDALASILERAGYEVWREFYLNDTGNQVSVLGESLEARFLQELGEDIEFPDDGYHGEYVIDFARKYIAENGDSLKDKPSPERRETLAQYVLPQNVSRMKEDLLRYGIEFDRFFAESSLYEDGYLQETMDVLDKNGHTCEKDGAFWFMATKFGCETDDVLRKANGFWTYYAADIAYHRDKFVRRGFDISINVLGADHHGHSIRFPSAIKALGLDAERLQFLIMQHVILTRDGETVRMSKRTGNAITLGDLLDEVSVDSARFFFNLRAPNTHLEFDLGLAVRQDSENPVYYVQYAHARLCSLIKMLAEDGFDVPAYNEIDVSLLGTETEHELIKQIAMLPEEIKLAARDFDPSKINKYVIELAARFHKFYNACRIKGESPELLKARLKLAASTRAVIKNCLELLGVSAPEKM